jgi:hypothetical protein
MSRFPIRAGCTLFALIALAAVVALGVAALIAPRSEAWFGAALALSMALPLLRPRREPVRIPVRVERRRR